MILDHLDKIRTVMLHRDIFLLRIWSKTVFKVVIFTK